MILNLFKNLFIDKSFSSNVLLKLDRLSSFLIKLTKYGHSGQLWGPMSRFYHIFVFFGYKRDKNGGIGEKVMLLSGSFQKLLSSEVMPIYGLTP